MYLTVNHAIENNTLKIKVKGVLDFSTVDSFDSINKTPSTVTAIDVDFSELEFIDSTGIGAILSILHTANKLGASVEFNSMSEETQDLFETIGVFDIKKTLLGEE